MKKQFTKVLALSIVASVFTAGAFAENAAQNSSAAQKPNDVKEVKVETQRAAKSDVSADEAKKLISNYQFLANNPGISFVKGVKRDKFYHLMFEAPNGQRFEVEVIPGSNFVIVGRVFNKIGQPQNLPADMNVVKEGVAFSIGHGPKTVYLVTDPQCPYCQDLEQRMNKNPKLTEEFTIKIIPMPLSFHKDAKPMYRYILSAKTDKEKAERMKNVMSGKDTGWKDLNLSKEEQAKIDEMIEKGIEAAKELGARGTPSTFDENGNQISPGVLLGQH